MPALAEQVVRHAPQVGVAAGEQSLHHLLVGLVEPGLGVAHAAAQPAEELRVRPGLAPGRQRGQVEREVLLSQEVNRSRCSSSVVAGKT